MRGQQLVEPTRTLFIDARQHIGDVRKRIDAARLAGRDERIQPSQVPASVDMPYEEKVLTSQRDASQSSLGSIVVERDARIVQEAPELVRVPERIANRYADRYAGGVQAVSILLLAQSCWSCTLGTDASSECDRRTWRAAAREWDGYFTQSNRSTSARNCSATNGAPGPPLLVPVRLYYWKNTDIERALSITAGLGRYLDRYGLLLSLTEAPYLLESRYLLPSSNVERADSSLEEYSAHEIKEALVKSIRSILDRPTQCSSRALDIVICDRIVDPTLLATLGIGDLTGLGVSPEFFNRAESSGMRSELLVADDFPDKCSPLAVIAQEELARLTLEENATAHEVGHALCLVHSDVDENLMSPNVSDSCLADLNASQVTTIRQVAAGL